MKRIRILLVLEATTGGAYHHVLQLAENLPAAHFEVSVMLSPERNKAVYTDAAKLVEKGIEVSFIRVKRSISPLHDLQALFAFRKHLAENAYDIIHAHSSKAGIIVRLADLFRPQHAVIYTPHCYFFQSRSGWLRMLFRKLEAFAARNTDYLVAVSEGERRLTLQEKIIAPEKIVTIPNAVDLREPAPRKDRPDIRHTYGIGPDRRVVTGVGRLAAQKDWHTFLRAAAAVIRQRPDTCFLIAGDGRGYRSLKKEILRTGLSEHIILAGYCRNMGEIYAISDIVLNTSLWEGMPYALLEAMHAHIPVVATNIPGNNDIIRHGWNGYLFDVRDHTAAAAAVIRLLDNEGHRVLLGSRGYEYVTQHHGLDRFIAAHGQLYRDAAMIRRR